jgi:[NiFe] hydrogenase diaphorase moiety large subunit
MSRNIDTVVKSICRKYSNDRTRMMDIARAVQAELGSVSGKAMEVIAKATGAHRVEVEGLVSFYAFLSTKPKGKVVIRLCDDVIDEMKGAKNVEKAFCEELRIAVGQTTKDKRIELERTPCIGMCDQAPAALINDVVFTHLTPKKAREIAKELKKKTDPASLVRKCGDGNNAHELVRSMVQNNIQKKDTVIFAKFKSGTGLKKALTMAPADIIRDMKASRLRGRGGAGFPTGMKWEFTSQAAGDRKYVVCNADEGEPGTFKDRAILTECPDLMFEGMTIGGYAIGAQTGILYLRGEYAYLLAFLENVLKTRREQGLLGQNIAGKEGFNFDIRIQMGAGAYVCGEETSLLSSCEGLRGDPKTRPPFPAQKGYLASPTTVNNVETFCCVPRIVEKGAEWFSKMGPKNCPGTKVLSISGDCANPGVYEVPFGIKLSDFLKLAGAANPAAVQLGGPSGQMIGPADFERTICYDDLATGGSLMVFGPNRNVLKIADKFMEFFVEESCGYCTPCRAGNVLLKERLDRIVKGKGEPADLDYLQKLGDSIKFTSRCGLGQTSPNPILTTLKNFRPAYDKMVKEEKQRFNPSFSIEAALEPAEAIAKRESVHF